MNAPQRLGNVQNLVVLSFRDVGLQNSLQTEISRSVFLTRRVGLECDRREEACVDDFRSQLNLFRRNQVAFPKFKRPTSHGCLKCDRSQDETAVWLQIIVFKKDLTAFQRKISAVDEVFVKLIELGIDVVNAIVVQAIDYKQEVR